MTRKLKYVISIFLGLAIAMGQFGSAYAAPRQDETSSVTGTIQSVVIEAGAESETQVVVVTILLASGEIQTVRLDTETATLLGLASLDESGELVVVGSKIGATVTIDPETILPEEPVVDEKLHPVGGQVADFFSNLLGVDYDIVIGSHADGFGFGVIVQSLWMTDKLGGDVVLFQTILNAKETGDYSMIILPDGSIPQSWGQLKKAVLSGEDGNSLGDVKPGGSGQGKPEEPGNGNGKPENPGNGNKPDTPGQGKDKDNGNNGKGKTK